MRHKNIFVGVGGEGIATNTNCAFKITSQECATSAVRQADPASSPVSPALIAQSMTPVLVTWATNVGPAIGGESGAAKGGWVLEVAREERSAEPSDTTPSACSVKSQLSVDEP